MTRLLAEDDDAAAVADVPPIGPLVEVLDHGREGVPRWIVVDAGRNRTPETLMRRAMWDARTRGYVPVMVDTYMQPGLLRPDELRDRTLLIVVRSAGEAAAGARALIDAAVRSSRPHVLLTIRTPATAAAARPVVVREARAVYGASALRPLSPAPVSADVARHLLRAARALEFVRAGRHAAAERLLRDVAGALARRSAAVPAACTLVTLGRLLLERGRAADAEEAFDAAATSADVGGDAPLAASARLWQAAARTDRRHLPAAEALCRAVLIAGTLTPPERLRAEATLARVLLWQGRVDEIVLPAGGGTQPDVPAAFVDATAVRVLLARGDLFHAGRISRQLMTRAEKGDDLEALIAHTAHLRVLAAIGDVVLARERMRHIEMLARRCRAPLRLARARLVYADMLRRTGDTRALARELAWLRRVCKVAPPLLRAAIDEPMSPEPAASRMTAAPAAGVLPLICIAHDEEEDRAAVARMLQHALQALRATRVDFCSVAGGPASILVTAGDGLPTRLGERVLTAGVPLGHRDDGGGTELGAPVRLGPRLIGAIVARWSVDRTAPDDARASLELVAAICAPRAEAMLAGARLAAETSTAVPELVGGSAAIEEVRRAIARAAGAPFAVLIEGESGAGKELVARAIHQLGPRRERRFCDVNCAALPDELLESELFGHARGAFTGAVADRAGLFEEAHGGTIFLDEVADLSSRAQAKLLRVVQQQEVRRVGETFNRPIDVRILCAANRDIRLEASEGRFRQDLRYRLDVIRLRIPPLRERPEDVALLATHFWRDAAARVQTTATLTHGVLAALARYHWPGNVRELQNVIAALAVAAPARGQVRTSLLPAAIIGAAAVKSPRLLEARKQFERRFIESALARCAGSRSRAAREMGISRQGLIKILARLGM